MVDKKDSIETAALINKIISDKHLRQLISDNQEKRLKDFQYEKINAMFRSYLEKFIATHN